MVARDLVEEEGEEESTEDFDTAYVTGRLPPPQATHPGLKAEGHPLLVLALEKGSEEYKSNWGYTVQPTLGLAVDSDSNQDLQSLVAVVVL
jgi:hypothetical protein